MKHRPHLLLEGPWEGEVIGVPREARHHLETVLRYGPGQPITYTDGSGMLGSGLWTGDSIDRRTESRVDPALPDITLAVAPPKAKERQRFIVEKAQELGVRRLAWLVSDHGQGRAVSDSRSASWAAGALEQSRGAWLMNIDTGVVLDDLVDAVLLDAAAPDSLGTMHLGPSVTLVVGPEGGFSDSELNSAGARASLPTNILRTETAAIVAVATILATPPKP